MSEVFGITVCSDFGKDMIQLDSVEAIAGKGIVEDRYFKKNKNTSNITYNIISAWRNHKSFQLITASTNAHLQDH